MDDPDMRYGFAIDALFRRRKIRMVKHCKCGQPMGLANTSNNQRRCNACRDKLARRGHAQDDHAVDLDPGAGG